jgi:TPR repeat protein
MHGEGVLQDKAKAARLFRQAAEQGLAKARYSLGACFPEGEGVLQDKAKAAQLFRQAADQGLAEAQFTLGICYEDSEGVPQDKAQAAQLYQQVAEQGLARAQYKLGICYAEGEGVPQDKAKAAQLFRQAADQGLAEAQCIFGVCYANGEGVPQDKAQATRWFRKAAEQGHALAQFNLGICCEHGIWACGMAWERPWLSIGWRLPGDTHAQMRTFGCALRRGGACRSTAQRPNACTSLRLAVAPSRRSSRAHGFESWTTWSPARRAAWRPQSRSSAPTTQCATSTSWRALGTAQQPSISRRSRGGGT